MCSESFITLQDLIEHLKHDCQDEEGQRFIRENSHITFVDCGSFSKPISEGQIYAPETKIRNCEKVNRKKLQPIAEKKVGFNCINFH